MKNILKKSALLLLAAFATLSACKKNSENPNSGSCKFSSASMDGKQVEYTVLDNSGKILKIVDIGDTDSTTYSITYNQLSQVSGATRTRKGTVSATFTFIYDANNNIAKKIQFDFVKDTISYTYNTDNKITKETHSQGKYYRYEYLNGNIIKTFSNYGMGETLTSESTGFDDKVNVFSSFDKAIIYSMESDTESSQNTNNPTNTIYYYNSKKTSQDAYSYEYNSNGLPKNLTNNHVSYNSDGSTNSNYSSTISVSYSCK